VVVNASDVDWSKYFASIHGVCPWSSAYWAKQKIDIAKWSRTWNIPALEDSVARVWIHKHASGRQLCNIHHRMNESRPWEEWLYSHPCYGGHSTPVPVLIQQDRTILERTRHALQTKSTNDA